MLSLSLTLFVMFYVSNQTVICSEVTTPDITRVIQNGGAPSSFRAVRATATCILPAYPDHGAYDALNVNNTQPGQSYNYLILSVRCERGYGMENSNTPYGNSSLVLCDQGVWYHAIPKCVRFCKLVAHPSVDYLCHTPDVGFKPCVGYLAPGTLVNPVCKSPEYSPNSPIILDMECVQGQWNYVAVCKEDCGRVIPEGGMGLIIGGTYTRHGQVPWHVGLYKKTSTPPYEQICGGSLVSSKVVISAAHCFVSRNPSDYAVASGKIYRLWDDKVDVNAQKSDVKEIKIPRLYQGAVGHFGVDIAVVVLATPFILNPFVRPVCLHFDTSFDGWQLRHGQLGKVAGWGLTTANGAASPNLQVVDLPFINEDSCINSVPPYFRPYITGDKFCAGYTNGTALCRGDSGGGLAFSEMEQGRDRFYLRGIVSTAARSDDLNVCNDRTYTAFTRIVNFQDFIKNVIAVSERKTCQGADCNENCVDGSRNCNPVTSTEKINPSTTLHVSDIPDSTNVAPEECAAIDPSMTSAKTGQKAFDKCIEYQEKYVYPCEKSGATARRGNHCLHDSVELIIGGTDTKPHEFPHMVMLGFEDDDGLISWQCGGSIISETYILTAAHCTSLGTGGLVEYVLIGAQTRSDANNTANVYKVRSIIRHPDYQPSSKYDDIALLGTEKTIPLSQYVVPACLHVGGPVDLEKVLATGWGVTEPKGRLSDVMQKVTLEKFSTAECGDIYSESRQMRKGFAPETQMCYGDRTDVKDTCTSDSGGPIQIKSNRLHCMYVIVGVTSFGRACGIPNQPSIYTRVEKYVPWIESIVWPSPSLYVPDTPDTTNDTPWGCAPIDSSITSWKTGQKAFDKCIEYQEKYVYPCEKSGATARRGNHCLHDSVELIVGGTDTKLYEFTHMVMLGYGISKQSIRWLCGGSIISEKYILSAAQCASPPQRGDVRYVLIGAHTKSDANNPANMYEVKRIIRHPDYRPPSQYNDILLLETEETIPLSQYVVPACLHVGDPVGLEKVLATGWGHTNSRDNVSEVMQKVILERYSAMECAYSYPAGKTSVHAFDPETQICYGGRGPEAKDTCAGDSGGPVQIKSKTLHCMYFIVGVTSYGKRCGILDEPAIYTRVQSYVPWIESIVWPNERKNIVYPSNVWT